MQTLNIIIVVGWTVILGGTMQLIMSPSYGESYAGVIVAAVWSFVVVNFYKKEALDRHPMTML